MSLVMLGGCWQGFVYDETVDGPYRMVAVDLMEGMTLCWTATSDHTGSCDSIVPNKVVAAGANKRFVVAARQPNLARFGEAPRFKGGIEFYYIVRTLDEGSRIPEEKLVIGPLTRPQFAEAKRNLGLPDFSQEVEDID